MYKFILDDSKPAYSTYVNLISSPAGHYLSRRPHVIALIKEILANRTLTEDRIVIEQDMGRDIGNSDIVATSDTDTIYYAQPLKSTVYWRFAKNRLPKTSNTLTVIVVRDAAGDYEVSDAWIGSNHPAFPGDAFESTDSMEYWQTHALVQNAEIIQAKSITKICPYHTTSV